MMSAHTTFANHVARVFMTGEGRERKLIVVVKAKSVKVFKEELAAESDVRHTKLFDKERVFRDELSWFFRRILGFKGQHFAEVEVVAATENEKLVRRATGHFLKVDTAEVVLPKMM